MSFGFSVGDFIAAIELANKIRKEFVDAPSQFKAVSDDVRSLSIVLQDADVAFSKRELNNEQKRDLEDIDRGCRNTLDELQRLLDKNTELKPEPGSVGKRIKRVWKRLKWDPHAVNELRSRISTNISFLDAFNGQITRDNVVKLVRYQEDQGRQTILDWITPIDFASQQNDFVTRRQAGTGQWLLDSVDFQAWLKTKQQTIFCPGIPGAGKTILTSIVIEDLYGRFQNDPDVSISYIYCNFRRQDEQKPEDLLASLLKQLTQGQSSLPENVKSLYDSHKDKRMQLTFDEISRALQSVAALYSRIFIIIDAIDECKASDSYRSRFLTEIFALQVKCGANVFATSRFIPEVVAKFNECTSIEIRARDEDVRKYLETQILQSESKVLKDYCEEVKTKIVEAVDGMFLLAQLHFQSIAAKKTPKKVKMALESLSTGSDAYFCAYEEAMERIEGQVADSEELAKQVLSWITFARRPLTTSELQHALAVEVDEALLDEENICQVDEMISVCAGLVTVDDESDIIRLVHYTAQEYFEQTQKKWFSNIQTDITIICATYLAFDNFNSGICQADEQFEERLRSNCLYSYASHNWGHHAREACTLIPEVTRFLSRRAQVEASSQALLAVKVYGHGYSQRIPMQMTGLHLAAYFGAEEAVRALLDVVSQTVKDRYNRTPLSWAAENGHAAVVKLLLAQDSVDPASGDKHGQTPLLWAAKKGHEGVVKLLLAQDSVNPESKDSDSRTPLLCAAENGHTAVVKLLLAEGVDLESKDNDGHTPLSWAIQNDHKAVMKLLLTPRRH